MVLVCLPSDALLPHLPSYLGFSYLGCGVSLQGCSSKAQPLLLTLEELPLLLTYGSIFTLQVILRGKYVIYKCCQMQYVFPNGTEWTRNIAGHILHLYYPKGKKEGRVERKSQQPFPALSIQRAHICCWQTYSRHWRWQVTWSQKLT